MLQLGSIGERLDLLARQGTTLGPFIATMQNPDTTPVDLTGCSIVAQARRNRYDTTAVNFTVSITEPLLGKYQFELPTASTSALDTGEELNKPQSIYYWDMHLVDNTSKVIALYYGELRVQRAITHA